MGFFSKNKVDFQKKFCIFVVNNKSINLYEMQGAPKYAKIKLTWKPNEINKKETTTEFENVGMVVTADKIIIVSETHDSITNMMKTEGSVFELSQLKSYETYKEKIN